jgi:hypothetical protein
MSPRAATGGIFWTLRLPFSSILEVERCSLRHRLALGFHGMATVFIFGATRGSYTWTIPVALQNALNSSIWYFDVLP